MATTTLTKVRFVRIKSSLRMIDLVNAGKRGATCREAVIYDLDYIRDPLVAERVELLLAALVAIDNYDSVVAYFRKTVECCGRNGGLGPNLDERTLRGVDVAPAGFEKIEVDGDYATIEADWESFSIHDKVDMNNLPTAIPPVRGAKVTAVKGFRKFVGANLDTLKKMTYYQILEAMSAQGIGYHDFCAMD